MTKQTINDKVFNTEKTDYEEVNLLLGKQDMGLFDTVNKQFPKIWSLYLKQKSQDWSFDEFPFASCNIEFKTCDRSQYEMMLRTLTWQWEADSVASKTIAPLFAPFITSSELWAALLKNTEIEVLHAATYSEIVRCSFDNPREVLSDILSKEEPMHRLGFIGKTFSELHTLSHDYANGKVENNQDTYNKVLLGIVGLLLLERVQFMASFAVTFAICDTGLFQPIGKAIQKIAIDELECHSAVDKEVLRHELSTKRGKVFYKEHKDTIKQMIDEVVESEIKWVEYLFSEGRSLVGMTAETLSNWTLFCAKDVYNFFDVKSDYKLPKTNPLRFMENWLNIGKTQPSPQEQQIGMYRLNVMKRDDDNEEFDVDF